MIPYQNVGERTTMPQIVPLPSDDNNSNDCEMPQSFPFHNNQTADDNPSVLMMAFNDKQNYPGKFSGSSSGPSAPPPSSCSTASDHSGSACPSPGPMKRFRQIYAPESVQPNSSSPQTARKAGGMNWTENWLNAHCQFSKPSTSTTPSVISNGSAVSQLSAISVDTQLSVAVDFLNLEPNIVQQAIPMASSSSSYIENVDPCFFQQIQHCLSQILTKLSSMNESQEFEALCQLYKMGKEHQFIYCTEPTQMCQIIQRLVEITLRPNTKQRTKTLTLNVLQKIAMAGNVCIGAIRSLESADRGFFLNAIIYCLRSETDRDEARFATNILSTLFTHPVMGEFFLRQARTQAIIRELMLAMQNEVFGFRYKFLRHIYHLIKASRELKRFFHQSNGMEICLKMFENSVDEPMLHGCAALILQLIDGLGRVAADHFVGLRGIQILAARLEHGSPRLLQCIARCLASASDSDAIAHQQIDDAIRKSIQLLASTDADLVVHVVGFIANVQKSKPEAKEFLQQNKAIQNLMFLLSVWAESIPTLPLGHNCEESRVAGICKHLVAQKTAIDDLLDTVLLALKNLSNGFNADTTTTCLLLMEFGNAPSLFLEILASSNRPENIHIRTLTLLGRIFTHLRQQPQLLERFTYARTKEGQKNYPHVLLERFFNAVQKFCSSTEKTEKDTVKALASRCLSILNELIKYQHFLASTASLFMASNWNPFLLLRSMQDEELERQYMELLSNLSASPDLASQFTLYQEFLRFYANIPHLANHAVNIFNRSKKMMSTNNNSNDNNNCINFSNFQNTG